MPGPGCLSSIMQAKRQVEHVRVLELQEKLLVLLQFRIVRANGLIQLLDADQRVLVGSVLVKKLVLHQTGKFAELRQVTTEEINLMHHPQNAADLALPRQDGLERLPGGTR